MPRTMIDLGDPGDTLEVYTESDADNTTMTLDTLSIVFTLV